MSAQPLARAFRQIGGMTAVSRVLGFVRDVVFAALLGAGTKQRRKHNIADKSQHTAHGRHPPDLAEGPCKRLGAHSAASPIWSNTSSNWSRIVVRRASL